MCVFFLMMSAIAKAANFYKQCFLGQQEKYCVSFLLIVSAIAKDQEETRKAGLFLIFKEMYKP
ncbi:hypothetical protein [Pseudanabaena sp. BC1403]|uniref:hypothetical protein n=1 Tax=Pseudanabaena sp. BC1403 TaxID=2043171 RepID=UPI000CD8C120|nr:hypothetical protein [Pseudanabaena sp. BC1403]